MARQVRVWPVIATFAVAIAFEIMPLPEGLQPFRPPLLTMVLIYWSMMWPQRIGTGVAFCMGICLDILHGQLLGQNALALTIVTYMTQRFHLQIRIFPLWQMTATIFALLALAALLEFLIEGLGGLVQAGATRWVRVLTGALLWPSVMGMLDRLRMRVDHRGSNFS